ncbi:hypothetical protein [Companilactobacillus nuruki]|uniref:DUF2273 domain-containing protein n=1 Tax=Companilactobacillus nuruki TaxID=1993540 RepID=A0A2N7AXT8_9LACO|nr:hypothetical protein [Companilactobacillus nuruki]PMD73876.1 hypothetical protein CBP76_00590 [Companilactobacillus nuruki]
MRRRLLGFLVGSLLVIIWITLGFLNLILIIGAGLIGYLIAALTGSEQDKESLRSKLIKILQLKE